MAQITPPIPLNNPITWQLEFLDNTNAPFDPPTVEFLVVDPTGALTTYTYPAAQITKTAVGNYSLITQATVAGDWVGKAQGTLANGTVLTSPDVVQTVWPTNV
jgi:hypothetical protein